MLISTTRAFHIDKRDGKIRKPPFLNSSEHPPWQVLAVTSPDKTAKHGDSPRRQTWAKQQVSVRPYAGSTLCVWFLTITEPHPIFPDSFPALGCTPSFPSSWAPPSVDQIHTQLQNKEAAPAQGFLSAAPSSHHTSPHALSAAHLLQRLATGVLHPLHKFRLPPCLPLQAGGCPDPLEAPLPPHKVPPHKEPPPRNPLHPAASPHPPGPRTPTVGQRPATAPKGAQPCGLQLPAAPALTAQRYRKTKGRWHAGN